MSMRFNLQRQVRVSTAVVALLLGLFDAGSQVHAVEVDGWSQVALVTVAGGVLNTPRCFLPTCQKSGVEERSLAPNTGVSASTIAAARDSVATASGRAVNRVDDAGIVLAYDLAGSVVGPVSAAASLSAGPMARLLDLGGTPRPYSATFTWDVLEGRVNSGTLDSLGAHITLDNQYVLHTYFADLSADAPSSSGQIVRTGHVSNYIEASIGATANLNNSISSAVIASALNIVIGKGASQDDPILPSVVEPGPGSFLFESAQSGAWFDPPLTDTFRFETRDGSLFTHILALPGGFDGPFSVSAGGQELGAFLGGDSVSFLGLLGHGVDSFEVSGIGPLVDAEDPNAFPIQLAFDQPTSTFSMTAVTVPIPGGLLLLPAAAGMLLRRRRRPAEETGIAGLH
ncbi:MAG: hypothetical protein H6977_07025 [Gammaproteobacteria bacterium]|nr:hypothetical protein [Gammaproteobacteria bacterium]